MVFCSQQQAGLAMLSKVSEDLGSPAKAASILSKEGRKDICSSLAAN